MAAGLAVLALGPAALTFARRFETYDLDDLFDVRGEDLRIHGDGRSVVARVVDVTEGRRAGPYRQVSLHLESDGSLPQGVHRVEHPTGGETTLLVVPVVHPADDPNSSVRRHGAFAYQIDFVRAARA